MKIRVAIAGYGNLGRGVEAAVTKAEDMELVALFTRRNPDDVKPVSGVPVYSMEKAKVKERIFIKKYNPIFNKCLNDDEYINDPFYEEWMKKKFHVRIDLGGFEI